MKKRRIHVILLIILIVAWTLFLFMKSPEQIIEAIGVNNGYLIVFFSSFLGDLATITVFTVYPTLIVFAIGGLNPFVLGLFAGIGITLANLAYFYIGEKGRALAERKSIKYLNKILRWCDDKPVWLMQIIVFLYVGFTPFPNNLLTASVGLINYKIRKIIVPLFLGNYFLMTFVAYLGSSGILVL